MSSNVGMDDSSQSETEIEPEFAIVPDVLTARKPVLPILFTRASTMIGGRMRIITGLILSPRSSGSLVTNMKKEAILALRNLQEPHLPAQSHMASFLCSRDASSWLLMGQLKPAASDLMNGWS
jgi:hypothetical protein